MEQVKPYKFSRSNKKTQVEEMFDSISKTYDTLNNIISLGRDKSWRKKVLRLAKAHNPKYILDIATGTAEMAIFLARINPQRIVGIDISNDMLAIAKKKIDARKLSPLISLQIGDGENLPFEGNSFDVITICFGVRNFENLEKGLTEARRVLRPNGMLIILETSVPDNSLLKIPYTIYTKYIMPKIGGLLSKKKVAYRYLSESAKAFPHGKVFCALLNGVGFKNISDKPQTFGSVTIYSCTK